MTSNMSFLGGIGLSPSRIVSLALSKLYEQFVQRDIKDFEAFHVAILDTFSTINMALPGKHYDAPPRKDLENLFNQCSEASKEDRKKIMTEFIHKNVNLNKVDRYSIITAIAAPPAAMVAKRTGQTMPQLKFMKVIPDVVAVPSATVLALAAVKILRLMFMGKTASRDAEGPHMEHQQQPQPSPDQPKQQPQPSSEPSEKSLLETSPEAQPLLKPAPAPPTAERPQDKSAKAPTQPPEHSAKGSFCTLCREVHS